MRIAVLGATGSVGRGILQLLDERLFPLRDVVALGSQGSVGRQVSMGGTILSVISAETFDFSHVDLVFSAVPAGVAERLLPKALKAGAQVIDKSSAFRMKPGVPLVIPEINGEDLITSESRLIASPNCIVIPLALALAPLHQEASLRRLFVSTYQAVSGVGRKGMDELYGQTRAILMVDQPQRTVFQKQIAFNVIPQIGAIDSDGWSDEETKVREEIQKIFRTLPSDPIDVAVTAVRVPVFIGHSMAVVAEFDDVLPVSVAQKLLSHASGIQMMERPKTEGGIVSPLETVGNDEVFVCRLRKASENPKALSFWVSCDNLRKGAALNAIQIAEALQKE
jgi:aspartate-semialdehyde dehydrogenase